jgi:molecular chaperone DnaJ
MDYYAILGLERGASDAEIKRAYRRLARQYHPGINPGDRAAEALFRSISEAYETLADPARRSQYDQAGVRVGSPSQTGSTFEFAGFDFSIAAHGSQAATFTELFADVLHPVPASGRPRPETGADLHGSLTVAFLDAVRGGERQVVVTRQVTCEACAGAGQVATPEGRCVQCQASGKVRWARGHMIFSKTCAACGGTGRQRSQRCAVCGGHGRGVRTEAIAVPVPAGIADGVRIRVPEKGHAGRHGGPTGDLYVTVHVQPDAAFRREGDDLVLSVPVAVHEAVLGARLEVPSLDGPVRVRIPPGTQAGQRFRLSGRGIPTVAGGRGDLIVEVRLVLPSMVDERSKELMREFGRLNAEDVRKGLMQRS